MRYKYHQQAALVRAPAQHDILPQSPLLAQGFLQGFEIAPLHNANGFQRVAIIGCPGSRRLRIS